MHNIKTRKYHFTKGWKLMKCKFGWIVLHVKTNFPLRGEWPLLHFVVRNVQIEHSRPNGARNNSVLNATIGHERITGLLMQISEADCALLSLEWECAHLDINHRKTAWDSFQKNMVMKLSELTNLCGKLEKTLNRKLAKTYFILIVLFSYRASLDLLHTQYIYWNPYSTRSFS